MAIVSIIFLVWSDKKKVNYLLGLVMWDEDNGNGFLIIPFVWVRAHSLSLVFSTL